MVESISSGLSLNISQLMQMQQKPPKPPSAEDMFGKLTQDVGGDGESITKDQLDTLISKLESSDDEKEKGKLGFLKQLQKNFDEIAGEDGSISVDELKDNMDLLKPQRGGPPPSSFSTQEWQDPSTITAEQLISPIDITV